jgi:predicted small lipoprotein YifL
MKNYSLLLLLLIALTGCGQIGPLYMPNDPNPPITVPKEQPAPKASNTQKNSPTTQSEPEKTK